MPPVALALLLIIAGIVAVIIILPLRSARKLRRRIRQSFGQKPPKRRGLAHAEDFFAAWARQHRDEKLVDDWTWNDLDGDEVFYRLNACQSAVGDVALYSALRRIPPRPGADGGALSRRQALQQLLLENPALRERLQFPLARLGRLDGNGIEMTGFQGDSFRLPRRWMYRLLAFLPFLSIPVFLFSLPLGTLALFVFVAVNFNLFALTKLNNDGAFRMVRYFASTLYCANKLARALAGAEPALAAALREATASMRGLRRSIAMLTFDHTMDETVGFDLLGIFLLPLLSYGRIAAQLAGRQAQILEIYRLVGEIDLGAALASYRESLPGWCAPGFATAPGLRCEALHHPLLDSPVPNSAAFTGDVLLTGSNASGKSTFIKAVALNCLFAQTIGICTAESFTLYPGLVASSMAVADSVVDGDSYFVAEIKSMRRLMRLTQGEDAPFCWFFIDEILKGTNTVERVAASSAVLHRLHAAHCLCFAATHDIELVSLLGEAYHNYHFRETVAEDGVFFDYRLHSGPATSRNAILLLQRMEFPADVIQNAQMLVARFEAGGEWGQLM